MIEYPDQRVNREAKQQDDFFKPTYDYLISKALTLNPKEKVTAWLQAANGIISNDSIKYLVSPLKDKNTEKTLGKLPGEIRDTDLINMIRERNIGEYIGIPYKFTVTVQNSDAILKRDLEVREEANKLMQQALLNMLNDYYEKNAENISTGIQSKEVPDIEKFVKDKLEKWIDERAIKGLHVLNLINTNNDFDTKRLQSFFYWWACEEFYTYREIINNEIYTSVISPLEGFPIYNNEQFVEDYSGFVIKKRTTLTKIKSLYWNELSEKEREYIEHLTKVGEHKYTINGEWLASRTWDTSRVTEFRTANILFDVTDTYEAIDEYTVVWRTEVPIKVRKYIDIYGLDREEIVSEDYIQNELDSEVRTEWIEEVYIGKRFGNEITGVYLKPHPCDVQRYDKHTMAPKLPVGGKKGILLNIAQNPIPNRLIPFVIIDRMILLQQERTMAKYQGYIQIIPKSMLNSDNIGTLNEKMFYIKADNTLMYDDTIVDFNTVAQGFRIIGMPAIEQYLKVLIELRDKYKAEALEVSNMNQYRLGDVMASTGKGVMEESIYRAALGNVLAITMFNAALERDHMADLEFSKIAYQDDIRGSYIDRSTGKPIYVELNLKEHLETQYGIFVENSKVDQEKIDMFRKIAFNASQNGDIDSAVAAVAYDSVPELRRALKEISEAQKELEQKVANQTNETQKYITDLNAKVQQENNSTIIEKTNIIADASIEVAHINAENNMQYEPDINTNNQESDNIIRRDELEFKRNDSNAKNALKERQLNNTNRIANDRLKIMKNKPKVQK